MAGLTLHIEITRRPELHPEAMRRAMLGAVHESAALLERAIAQRTPQGLGGSAGLKGSIFGEVRDYATKAEGIVSTPLAYALPVEYGRRAGAKMPPVSALIPWVEKTLSIQRGETAKGIAFAIARYMARRGSRAWRNSPPGVRMFERGFEAAQPLIERVFADRFRQGVKASMV